MLFVIIAVVLLTATVVAFTLARMWFFEALEARQKKDLAGEFKAQNATWFWVDCCIAGSIGLGASLLAAIINVGGLLCGRSFLSLC